MQSLFLGRLNLTNRHIRYFFRLFWLIVLLACSGCLYLLLVNVAEKGAEVNYTPDTLYLTWTTAFPAVTVCEAFDAKYVGQKLAEIYRTILKF